MILYLTFLLIVFVGYLVYKIIDKYITLNNEIISTLVDFDLEFIGFHNNIFKKFYDNLLISYIFFNLFYVIFYHIDLIHDSYIETKEAYNKYIEELEENNIKKEKIKKKEDTIDNNMSQFKVDLV